jgi:hypothetical protein
VSRRARYTFATILALVLVGLISASASAWHPPTTEAEAHRRAVADARRRAESIRVPPGATEVAKLPGRLGFGKAVVPESSRWIDIPTRWRSREPMAKVIAYFRSHRPRGSSIKDEGAQIFRGRPIEHGLELTWDQNGWQAESRNAFVRIVPDGSGSAFRIDTVASWKHPDPSADIVPTTGFLKIELDREEGNERTRQVAELTDRATIASIASIAATINEAPFFGPHTKVCPEPRYTADLWLTFRDSPDGKEVAGVRQELPPCAYSLEPEVEGKFSHDRTGGQALLEAVEPLLPAPERVGKDEEFRP